MDECNDSTDKSCIILVRIFDNEVGDVQKRIRIKTEMPHLYDVGCINHMADVTIKAGMETLPVNIDQVFVDILYYFDHSSKRGQLFVDH